MGSALQSGFVDGLGATCVCSALKIQSDMYMYVSRFNGPKWYFSEGEEMEGIWDIHSHPLPYACSFKQTHHTYMMNIAYSTVV